MFKSSNIAIASDSLMPYGDKRINAHFNMKPTVLILRVSDTVWHVGSRPSELGYKSSDL